MSQNHSEHDEITKNLHVFYIKYDLLDSGLGQVTDKFNDELFEDIPDFAFGADIAIDKLQNEGLVPTVREAMKMLYSIPEIVEGRSEYLDSDNTEDKYIKRGEFGELLLYHLLHEYFDADSLISKIYFKDSRSIPAHGFDAVHVDEGTKTLWLGESKIYKSGSLAIDALSGDLVDHFNTDFFNSEFTIITNRIRDGKTNQSDWIKKLVSPNTKTLDKLASVNIALFAAFNSGSIHNYNKNTFQDQIDEEAKRLENRLKEKNKNHAWKNNLNIYLFLFPLEDKREFVSKLHQKLKGAQQI
ncbi:hypothetical protein CG419_04245 [Latilactobacillus curvatus]|uniref:Anti-bacteriophage protein A/HamA C-terminal domain-containing protein n=1 Tax=Latilactobacillus curvatus TaxID=28038 RepID=A0AAC9UR72_LATCU|nr:DUF1837 domain-containing protein [Latilactobacillus curvatus]ASN59885.1 hypothetical protein CG419_04245 [Latilactobacillus curvatus]